MKVKGTHALIAFGPLLVLSFYATWLAGRFHLGHWPRPSLDDPKDIEGFWMWTYGFTGLVLTIGLPVAVVLAGASVLRPALNKSPEWKVRLAEAILGIVLLALAFAFIRLDPHRVVEWYMD
jgi:hypothetical protein